jgi:hypothetical protein
MKNIIITLLTLLSINTYSQNCYSVKEVKNEGEIEGVNPNRFLLGVKQITEEILSTNYSICQDGKPVSVTIQSIEAPTNSFSLGPFEKKKKKTIVKLVVIIDKEEYEGEGQADTDVSSTFIELQDENLPFEKSAFSGALKKALQDAISKI